MNANNLSSVLENDLCIGCGACIPTEKNLKMEFNETTQTFQPNGLGNQISYDVCPSIKVDYNALQKAIFPDELYSEHGVLKAIYLAQTIDYEKNYLASSGGIVKDLLKSYLLNGDIDGVISIEKRNGIIFEPAVIESVNELERLPQSIYHNLSFHKALTLLRKKTGKYVLVALPCHLEGIYNYIIKIEPELMDRIHTTIGLSCGWCYNHHAIAAICKYKFINRDELQDISYRGKGPVGKLRIESLKKVYSISRRIDFSYQVAFDRSFNLPRCHLCVNHVNYLADIVVADAWLSSTLKTKTGISLVICRTDETNSELNTLHDRGTIRLTNASVDDIVESQKRRNAFGDFAYSYSDFLKKNGYFCPDLIGPNRPSAKLVNQSEISRFHSNNIKKRKLQEKRQYWTLWLRKATIELLPLYMRYWNWFASRVLKIQSEKKNYTISKKVKDQLESFY